MKLPTPKMRQLAMPEGILAPGGYVEGWLYFEEVPDGAERVAFNYWLRRPSAPQPIGAITIPIWSSDAVCPAVYAIQASSR